MGSVLSNEYLNMYIGWNEMMLLLPIYNSNLLFDKRVVNDKAGIWIGSSSKFQDYQRDLNNFSILRWKFSPLSTKVNFLDLEISINNGIISTKTFEKPSNLHFYILSSSAHPHGCLKGLIEGMVYRYFRLNSNLSDFLHIIGKFFTRLVYRGYKKDNIKEMILDATEKVISKTS